MATVSSILTWGIPMDRGAWQGVAEDEMVRWHQPNGHEFEQILGDGEGQGSLACFSPWSRKELDTTEQLTHTQCDINSFPVLIQGKSLEERDNFSLLLSRDHLFMIF